MVFQVIASSNLANPTPKFALVAFKIAPFGLNGTNGRSARTPAPVDLRPDRGHAHMELQTHVLHVLAKHGPKLPSVILKIVQVILIFQTIHTHFFLNRKY